MSLLQDLRFAVRLLVKDRWFTAVAVLALALGIGVNATVFTFVNAVLIRGLPFDDPDRIMSSASRDAREPRSRRCPTWTSRTGARATRTFTGLAAFSGADDERQRRRTDAGTLQRSVHLGERASR